jgi:hypothetical protein
MRKGLVSAAPSFVTAADLPLRSSVRSCTHCAPFGKIWEQQPVDLKVDTRRPARPASQGSLLL